MPTIVSTPNDWQNLRKTLAGSIGFVPTMGNLHEGHIDLCRRARTENDIVVASVFVNPTQFNQPSDFEKYARTLAADQKLLSEAGVDYLFHPDAESMYPDGYSVKVSEEQIAGELEGAFRPGHFTGMLTVVLKLLNIIGADRAYFGEKDFQQLLLVKKMVASLFLPVEIVACPTVRAENGLALSSRNARLTPAQLEKAPLLAQLLQSGIDDAAVMKKLEEAGFKPEYVETRWGRRLAAAWLGDVRLIDNVPAAGQINNSSAAEKHNEVLDAAMSGCG
ncbi:MAG: pantoate--beta-alanine ligase [Alphaproteobacteria bacterium]